MRWRSDTFTANRDAKVHSGGDSNVGIQGFSAPASSGGRFTVLDNNVLDTSPDVIYWVAFRGVFLKTGKYTGNGADDRDLISDTGTANAAVSTTTGPPGTLTDTREAWPTNQWVGATVTCNGKTMVIASNTATVLTGTAGWSGGGNPGNGNAWTIT